MIEVKIHPIKKESLNYLFVVIAARYKDNWIWVKHRDRDTWEIPGGHIEENESPDNAAKRELIEETGAVRFKINPVCDYSVKINETFGISRLYIALVEELGSLPESEIGCIGVFDEMPEKLTYPEIQPILFKQVLKYINN